MELICLTVSCPVELRGMALLTHRRVVLIFEMKNFSSISVHWIRRQIVLRPKIFLVPIFAILFMAKESLGGVLLTLHNLRFFVKLMEDAREQIKAGTFAKWATDWTERYNTSSVQ